MALASYNPAETVYIGGQDAAELLQQFPELRGSGGYSAVFILTDKSGYHLAASPARSPARRACVKDWHCEKTGPLGLGKRCYWREQLCH